MRHTIHPCVHLIVQKGHEVLLSLRQNTGYEDGTYAFVSGHVEKDEGAISGMIREAKEEIGIEIKESDLACVLTMHHKSNRENMHLFFVCSRWKGDVQNNEPEKCSELRFFPKRSLPVNFVPYHQLALECIEKGIRYVECGFKEVYTPYQQIEAHLSYQELK